VDENLDGPRLDKPVARFVIKPFYDTGVAFHDGVSRTFLQSGIV
jgi:hypothetical protein